MSRTERYLFERELGASLIREESGEYSLFQETQSPVYDEITSPDELRNPECIAEKFASIDWSFTEDDTGFLTHDLHPYPAKFIPQIPGYCIAKLSLPGELVFDPFGGSGTTALEAVRSGRRALSIDANAVGTLIGRVKTSNLERNATKELHALRSYLTTRSAGLPLPDSLCRENADYLPDIPNIDKWFPVTSRGELAAIIARIAQLKNEKARDIALLAVSRIALAVSFQDSETRYSSKPRDIPQGETIKRYLTALDTIIRNVMRTQPSLRYSICDFLTGDSRKLGEARYKSDSIDLIVTSPPYGNANDYHLYHRFRLLWIGHDPRQFGKVEIGSHLRHQKESSGFDTYIDEIQQCLSGMYRLLKSGRYAVLVVGDAVYKKTLYQAANAFCNTAEKIGFETVCIVERNIHKTKRSFVSAGRRAMTENLLVLRKPPEKVSVWFFAPPYKPWPYEDILRKREVESTIGVKADNNNGNAFNLMVDPYSITKARKLVYTHGMGMTELDPEPTWQAIVENGFVRQPSARKDPKYITHGLHPYKGKFYPQLAKSLMNLSQIKSGGNVFDPFCGSGTTLLEGYLNGYHTYGCDMNPLAAKIAKAKVGILEINPDVVRETFGTLVSQVEDAPTKLDGEIKEFNQECLDEILSWFPLPVISKIDWLLSVIRSVSDGVIRDFFEVILSSIIRDVSQQDPTDLRIRRRKIPLQDADVFQRYLDALDTQYARIEKFWSVRGYSPVRFQPCKILEGDSRDTEIFTKLGISRNSIDLILTSPPYATALPYIDTDRLSLMLLFGMGSSSRRPVEQNLIGSREIKKQQQRELEHSIAEQTNVLPDSVNGYLKTLYLRVSKADVGFRRKNMPALLSRFFLDMASVLENCCNLLSPGGEAMIVIGDNRMRVDSDYERIPTTEFVRDIALERGMELIENINISVTRENFVHIKNAITENVVIRLKAC